MVFVEMLAPAAVLVLWSLVMLLWMVATRFAAFGQMKVDLGRPESRGGRGRDLEGRLPERVMWKAHNHDHLMEQPTIFYPTVIVLALTGPAALDIGLAWAYVVLRIAHSFWQSLVNTIPVRLAIFTLATLCLIVLAVRALLATLGAA